MGRKSKLDIRKIEILGHLYKVIKEQGLEGASLAKVANSMGVYPSMLVHYFKTKDQMMAEFVDYIMEQLKVWYYSDVENIEDPKMRFDTLLDRMFMIKGQGYIDLNVFYAIIYLSFRDDQIKEKVLDMYAFQNEILLKEVKLAKDKGLIKAEEDPNQLVYILSIVTEGIDYCSIMMKDVQMVQNVGLYLKHAISSRFFS